MSAPLDLAALARLIVSNCGQVYPHQHSHLAVDDTPLPPPPVRHPVFHGCYDWHSAVHSHWALWRLRAWPAAAPIAAAHLAAVRADALAGELGFLVAHPRFELPYGLAWLLALDQERRRAPELDPVATAWSGLAPLANLARDRLLGHLGRLPAPIRTGEHAQSALAMTLVRAWAIAVGDAEAAASVDGRALAWFADPRPRPLHFEPSGYDFLSPSLAEAELLAQVLPADAFARWLGQALPTLGAPGGPALVPPVAADVTDGKLVHWDGLALSRAWMLDAIAAGLPGDDPRRPALRSMARRHGQAGLAALDQATYAGTHWLPTFAIRWLGLAGDWPADAVGTRSA
ncbi:MAG: DUF2891 family protein [Kofleriaceae bacterium]|nr:DUF2891 family protein [Kofleriaceae bacterium]